MNISITDHINQYHKYLEEWKNLRIKYQKEEKDIKNELYFKFNLGEDFKEELMDIKKRRADGYKIKYQTKMKEINSDFITFDITILANSVYDENNWCPWGCKYYHYNIKSDEIRQITSEEYYGVNKTMKIFGITSF
jgi:hypothetical protein